METRIDHINTVGDRVRLLQRTMKALLLIAFGFLLCFFVYVPKVLNQNVTSNSTGTIPAYNVICEPIVNNYLVRLPTTGVK